MDKALYRKYRSKGLDEVAGQEHITGTLKNSLKSGKISHAYLLSGPRGVGKTSVARILAHEFNGLKYDEETLHLDIIEIDAASNRRIEEIRDLREKVHIAPTSLKYKVYIIDEAHMLTREAFNALLKTLEEPPEHCIFILATTEAHKLPETIISRTQHFSFRPIDVDTLSRHLKTIAKKEGVNISDEAINELAVHSGGSFRDGISMLDQLRHFDKKITAEHVEILLGLPPKQLIADLYKSLEANDIQNLVKCLELLQNGGFDAKAVAEQLLQLVKSDILSQQNDPRELIIFSKKLLNVPISPSPGEYLELICLEYADKVKSQPVNATLKQDYIEPTVPEPKALKISEAHAEPDSNQKSDFAIEKWPQLLSKIKQSAPALYTVLRLAKTRFDGKVLELGFAFNLHYKKATSTAHKKILADTISENAKKMPKIEYVLDKSLSGAPVSSDVISESMPADSGKNDLSAINNIFGGSEILET